VVAAAPLLRRLGKVTCWAATSRPGVASGLAAFRLELPNVGLGFGDHLLEQLDHFWIVREVNDLSDTLYSVTHAGDHVFSHWAPIGALAELWRALFG
jgi:hypothetical protein